MPGPPVALLAADEPSAVVEYRSGGASPFLLVCDHAGRRIPRSLRNLGVGDDALARHIAWDIGIEGVGRRLADRLDACLIMQPYSRLVIDCNRPPGTPESIVNESDGVKIPGNADLPASEAALRVKEIFAPYHAPSSGISTARKSARVPTVLVSLHSFTPVYAGYARPWQAGVLYNRYRALADAPARRAEQAWRSHRRRQRALHGRRTRPTTPSPCMASSAASCHVAIEIRQDLIADETGQIDWAGRLAATLPKAVAKIS